VTAITCPCCNGRGTIEHNVFDILTPSERNIYTAIWKRKALTIHQLVEALYGHRPDGGPEFADKSIHVIVSRLNKKLKAKGYQQRVHADQRGAGAVYRIYD